MRTRRAMPPMLRLPSDPELPADLAVDLAAVRATAGGLHDRPHQGADRLLVAALDALDDVRVVGQDPGDDAGQLAVVLHRAEPLALDDRGGVAALLHEQVQDRAGVARRGPALPDEAGQPGD